MNINLATADQAELKAHAKNELDLSLSMNMNADTMRTHILARYKELKIDAPVGELVTKHEKTLKIKKRIVINIPKSEKVGGAEPAIVGVQGVLYTIPRGVDIAVSPAVVEVLKNGIQDIVTQDPDSGEIYKEPVPTYPFQIVRTIEEDVAA